MLSNKDIGLLRDAIVNAFDLQALEQMLTIRVNKNFDNYAPGSGVGFRVFKMVQQANMEGWDAELIEAIIAERPKSRELLSIAIDVGVSFHLQDAGTGANINTNGLQGYVNADPLFDPQRLLFGISKNKRCVCRIEVSAGNKSYGTGFLVGADLVLTNYHVIENFLANPADSQLRCRFDYEVTANGKAVNAGVEVSAIGQNAVMAFSPYADLDKTGVVNINDVQWPTDKLDYALIKLEEAIGNKPFGLNAEMATSEPRGWIKHTIDSDFNNGSHMIIIQHPDKQPVKISFGLSKVIGTDNNKRRVRYLINTENGSSGSACFDQDFNWIALHNSGDPSWNPKYNQGIPCGLIIEDLKNKGINL